MNRLKTCAATAEERFWSRVEKTDGCWLWRGARNAGGYGSFMVKGRMTLVHRYSVVLHGREIPDGMFACHTCDNPSCVNPAHLFIGTPLENSTDAYFKGRTVNSPYKGRPNQRERPPEPIDDMTFADEQTTNVRMACQNGVRMTLAKGGLSD